MICHNGLHNGLNVNRYTFKGKQLSHFLFCLPSCWKQLLKEKISSNMSKLREINEKKNTEVTPCRNIQEGIPLMSARVNIDQLAKK